MITSACVDCRRAQASEFTSGLASQSDCTQDSEPGHTLNVKPDLVEPVSKHSHVAWLYSVANPDSTSLSADKAAKSLEVYFGQYRDKISGPGWVEAWIALLKIHTVFQDMSIIASKVSILYCSTSQCHYEYVRSAVRTQCWHRRCPWMSKGCCAPQAMAVTDVHS